MTDEQIIEHLEGIQTWYCDLCEQADNDTAIESGTIAIKSLDHAIAALRELAAAREAVANLRANCYLDDGVLFRYSGTTAPCKELRELFALFDPQLQSAVAAAAAKQQE